VLTAMTRWTRNLVTRRGGERGQALLFVLIAVTLLASIPIALATTTVDQLPQTTRNLNYEAAYEAAQAGLNDYVQNLDADEAYGLYCKTCDSGTDGNLAFTQWVQASTTPPEYYTYAVINTNGVISLEVSGKAGTGDTAVVRTFKYGIKPATSLDDVYWSNYETRDPILGAMLPSPPTGYQYCNVHYGQPDPYQADESGGAATGPPIESACQVSFQTGDVLNGPIFSDDTYSMCGSPEFDSTVQSGNIYNTSTTTPLTSAGQVWYDSSGCGSATPTFDGAVTKVGNQTPRSASDDLTPARDYGCFITGVTSGSLNHTAGVANTNLTPLSNVTVTLATSGSGSSETTKVTWSGTGTNVDNVSTNTNNCASGFTVSSLQSGILFVNGNVTVSGTMAGGLDIVTCSSTTDAVTGNCNSTTESNITISGNLTYPSADITSVSGSPVSDTSDALGLVAQNFVIVDDVANIDIDAAILAINDSFYVTDWYGATGLGDLNVFGSIAQNFRGPVATSGGTGFTKNYNYDSSLQTLFPPFFISPNGATWSPTSYEECAPGSSQSVLGTPSC
jgi:type II secretory pathway component PulJ